MLKVHVVEPTTAGWASPFIFVAKKDGTYRFCVVYCHLNAVPERDSYAIPRIDDRVDSHWKAWIFSTLDANKGYRKIEVEEKDVEKIAFATHRDLYRNTKMPLELWNAPEIFQSAMDGMLASVKNMCAIVYMDDVNIFYVPGGTPDAY